MCGICGFYAPKNRLLLEQMSGLLKHRGPDMDGFYEDDKVSLGHRRLSIIDLSADGRQPIANENLSIEAVVNGEIYNYRGLRENLILRGHKFKSSCDSEVVVHAYEQFGDDFVRQLDGMFALAVWDASKNRLVLARDRIGIKPLYYTYQLRGFFFASEIKAIACGSFLKRELNEDSFWEYLAFQCSLSRTTLFKGITKLMPAEILIYDGKNISLRNYWDLKELFQGIDKTPELALKEAVSSHLCSDVPVGVLLSGGLDSSSIVALMRESGAGDIQTFTIGFNQPDDEFRPALSVANKFSTTHHELLIEPERISKELEKIVWHMDEPLADGGAIATYLAAQEVKKQVKVVLVGEGGDEALAGYRWHKLGALPFNIVPECIRKKIYFYLTTFYRQANNLPFKKFQGLFSQKGTFLEKICLFEIANILPNSLLMKVDKMTMAHSLEARVPFLDHNFLRVAMSIRVKDKISMFTTKKFLRNYMQGRLPSEILRRPKHGFILPVNRLLNGELRVLSRDILLSRSSKCASFIPTDYIRSLFCRNIGLSEIENKSLLWRLLIFELWHKTYFKTEHYG